MPYRFMGALYHKVRDGVRYIVKAALVVTGVWEGSHQEILGVKITECENEAFWPSFFEELKERGLTGVRRVIFGGHTGIQKAVSTAFLGAACQMCQVCYTRAVLLNIPKKYQNGFAFALR